MDDIEIPTSDTTLRIRDLLFSLMEEHDGRRIVSKLRLTEYTCMMDYSLTAYLGTCDGRAMDLRNRSRDYLDEYAIRVLETLVPFTDNEIRLAMQNPFVWRVCKNQLLDVHGEITTIEYSME